MLERTILAAMALHARPLDQFVRAARTFSSQITIRFGDKEVDATTVMALLLLAVPKGGKVTITARGPDEELAVQQLAEQLAGEKGQTKEAGKTEAREEQKGQKEQSAIQGTEDSKQCLQNPKEAPLADPISSPPWRAVPGAPGRGAGLARFEKRPQPMPRRHLRTLEEERDRLERAIADARRVTRALVNDDDPFCDIFKAQQTMLEDTKLHHDLGRIVARGYPAEHAVSEVFADLAASFDALEVGFAADRHADVADLRDRILEALGIELDLEHHQKKGERRWVWILEEATPSRLATIDPRHVAAIISKRGGPTSHAAIVARARRFPLVFALPELLAEINDGDPLLIDGDSGMITIDDKEQQQLPPQEQLAGRGEANPALLSAVPGPTQTKDGVPITLRANLGAPGDLKAAQQLGSDGCGLLRTELLFGGRRATPSVDEQASAYSRFGRALAPGPVVVRLFDAGSDKPLPFLRGPEHEPNPALGQRGVRLLLEQPQLLADQLTAIYQARQSSGCDLRAMVPFVIDANELRQLRDTAPELRQDLPLGAMIETPAAALLCAAICKEVSFVSIGTNDLSQYVLARDRRIPSGEGLVHPAVLSLIGTIINEARESGVECSVCGELAGTWATVGLLVGLGVSTLSIAPAQIPLIREMLSQRSFDELAEQARQAKELADPRALSELLHRLKPSSSPLSVPEEK